MLRRLFSTNAKHFKKVKFPKMSDNGNVWADYGLLLKKQKTNNENATKKARK